MKFSDKIIKWYLANKRNLPWRVTKNPYKIWLSEIILQQTRIDQGTSYYLKFVEKYPNINSLATANEQEVLKLWQGLGYYSRARNLLKTANIIVNDYSSIFPSNYKEIISLPGIGEYTAAAISSISFNEAHAVIDGNVIRVLSRVFGIQNPAALKKDIKEKANKLIDKSDPGNYNQAVMEFGALYCKPQNPDCFNCIFQKDCFAFKNQMVDKLPLKNNPVKQKKRYFHYLVLKIAKENEFYTLLNRRSGNDIWRNMYDFPMIEKDKKIATSKMKLELKNEFYPGVDFNLTSTEEFKHILTHQLIFARFYVLKINDKTKADRLIENLQDKFTKIPIDSFHDYPVPRLIEKVINETQIL